MYGLRSRGPPRPQRLTPNLVEAIRGHGFRESKKKPSLYYRPVRREKAVFLDYRARRPRRPGEGLVPPRFYSTLDDGFQAWDAPETVLDEIAYVYWKLGEDDLIETECMLRPDSVCASLQARRPAVHPEVYKNWYRCRHCGEHIEDSSRRHTHHISYDPEITTILCDSCHGKVHNSDDPVWEYLRPEDARPKQERKIELHTCAKYKGTCHGGGKVQVPYGYEGPPKKCFKCRTKKERDEKQRKKRERWEKKGGGKTRRGGYVPVKKPHWKPGDPMP